MNRQILTLTLLIAATPLAKGGGDISTYQELAGTFALAQGCPTELVKCFGIERKQCESAWKHALNNCGTESTMHALSDDTLDTNNVDETFLIWLECMGTFWTQNLGIDLNQFPHCEIGVSQQDNIDDAGT